MKPSIERHQHFAMHKMMRFNVTQHQNSRSDSQESKITGVKHNFLLWLIIAEVPFHIKK